MDFALAPEVRKQRERFRKFAREEVHQQVLARLFMERRVLEMGIGKGATTLSGKV